MPQITLHLINRTKFNLIFDYKNREHFVLYEFDKTIDVESGSLIYVYLEKNPDGYRQSDSTLEANTEIECRMEFGKLYMSATGLI